MAFFPTPLILNSTTGQYRTDGGGTSYDTNLGDNTHTNFAHHWRTQSFLAGSSTTLLNPKPSLGWNDRATPTPNSITPTPVSGPAGRDDLDNWTLVNTNGNPEIATYTASVTFGVNRVSKISFKFFTDLDDAGDSITIRVYVNDIITISSIDTWSIIVPTTITGITFASGDTSQLTIGMSVTGTGIRPGSFISNIVNGNTITLNKPTINSSGTILMFRRSHELTNIDTPDGNIGNGYQIFMEFNHPGANTRNTCDLTFSNLELARACGNVVKVEVIQVCNDTDVKGDNGVSTYCQVTDVVGF